MQLNINMILDHELFRYYNVNENKDGPVPDTFDGYMIAKGLRDLAAKFEGRPVKLGESQKLNFCDEPCITAFVEEGS